MSCRTPTSTNPATTRGCLWPPLTTSGRIAPPAPRATLPYDGFRHIREHRPQRGNLTVERQREAIIMRLCPTSGIGIRPRLTVNRGKNCMSVPAYSPWCGEPELRFPNRGRIGNRFVDSGRIGNSLPFLGALPINPRIPAESATGGDRESRFPAESATATSPLRARCRGAACRARGAGGEGPLSGRIGNRPHASSIGARRSACYTAHGSLLACASRRSSRNLHVNITRLVYTRLPALRYALETCHARHPISRAAATPCLLAGS